MREIYEEEKLELTSGVEKTQLTPRPRASLYREGPD